MENKFIIQKYFPKFDLESTMVASVATKYGAVDDIDEFTGRKTKSTYKYNGEIVCTKHFTLINHIDKQGNVLKGTQTELRYYKTDGSYKSFFTSDYYTNQEIKDFTKKNVITVWTRLITDLEDEIKATLAAAQTPEQAGQAQWLKGLFDEMFTNVLKVEIDYLYKNGDTKPLYDRLNSGEAVFENLKMIPVATSERSLNLFQVLCLKFNPQNFRYYENS